MKISVKGYVTVRRWRESARGLWIPIWEIRREDNISVNAALTPMASLLGGDTAGYPVSVIGFGSGSSAVAVTDAALTAPSYFRGINSHSYPAAGQVMFTYLLTLPTVTRGTWAATTSYSVNDTIYPATQNGHYFVCATAGTSDSSEPAWNTATNGATNDGTAIWHENGQADTGANGLDIQEMGLFCNPSALGLPIAESSGSPSITMYAHKLNPLGAFAPGGQFTGTWTLVVAVGG